MPSPNKAGIGRSIRRTNQAGILQDADADPEGLVGGEYWSPLGNGSGSPENCCDSNGVF